MDHQVIIVGGGITGLTAAVNLEKKGVDYLLIEATEEVGGRVKTREVDGFLFDRGFQVLLTGYPEAQDLLDYGALKLNEFKPGAMLLLDGGSKSIFGDPMRDSSALWSTVFSKGATFLDKLAVFRLSSRLKATSLEKIFKESELTTLEYLRRNGFSTKIIETFFRPFFGGIFLESELTTSSRMFEFVFKMFSEGAAALPENGMQEIPRQLVSGLDSTRVHTSEKVISIDQNSVQTDQRTYRAENIIIATDALALSESLGLAKPKFVSTIHAHFSSEVAPFNKPLIALQSNRMGIVNNLCVVNKVSKAYAQKDNLISVTLRSKVAIENVETLVRKEMKTWFPDAGQWKLIDLQNINYALPDQRSVSEVQPFKREKSLWISGDHMMHGSLNAAMKSGRQVAEAIAKQL